MKDIVPKFGFIGFPLLFLGLSRLSYMASEPIDWEWLHNLNKAPLSPPGWIFGIVWPILYICIGLAVNSYWKVSCWRSQDQVFWLMFTINMICNYLYMPICFGEKVLELGAILCVASFTSVGTAMTFAAREDKKTFYFLIPYYCWMGFASYLSIASFILN